MENSARKKIALYIDDTSVKDLRLDRFIAENLNLFPRNQIAHHKLEAKVNEKPAKLSKKVSAGDHIEITYADLEPVSYKPEKIHLDIIYEDRNVIVVNKPQGMVVHPAAGNWTGTLVQGLLYHCREIAESFEEGEMRPGVVHRLDKETSGVIIAAKHPGAQNQLASQFKQKRHEKNTTRL